MNTISEKKWHTLFLIIAAGLLVRIYALDKSIWLDEGYSIVFAGLKLSEIFFLQDGNPPLYYSILHIWIRLFGNSEISIRMPSVISGLLAIWTMYRLGRDLFDQRTGILSAMILSLSVFHLDFSQEARTYSLTMLLTLLSMHAFIRLFSRQDFGDFAVYILSGTLLMYAHVYGLFIIIAQNIYYFSTLMLSGKSWLRPRIRQWIALQCILLLCFAPWIGVFVTQIGADQGAGIIEGAFSPVPDIRSLISTFLHYTAYDKPLFLLFLSLAFFAVFSLGRAAAMVFPMDLPVSDGSVPTLRYRKYFLLIWLIIPVILPFIISRFTDPIYKSRYTAVAALAFYLLAARGIANIGRQSCRWIVISLVIAFSLADIAKYHHGVNTEQWKEAAGYVEGNAAPDDLLLFNAGGCLDLVFNYYSRRTDLTKKKFPEKTRFVDEEGIKALGPAIEGFRRVWVILSHSRDKGLIVKTLGASHRLLHSRRYTSIRIYLFERRDAPDAMAAMQGMD